MRASDSYLWVGIFVCVSVLAGLFLLLQIADSSSEDASASYKLVFARDVSGLALGSPVSYMGVGVGRVASIRLAMADHPTVEVQIDVSATTPVSTATYATLAYQGVTGVAQVNLIDDPSLPATALPEGGETPQVLPTRDAGIAAILADGPLISARLGELLDRANRLLNDDNIARLQSTLVNLEALSQGLSADVESYAALPAEANAVLQRANKLLARVDSLSERAAPDVLAGVASMREASADLAAVAGSVNEWMLANEPALDRGVGESLRQLPALLGEARSTLSSLELLVDSLAENPSRLLYQPRSDDLVVLP